MPRTRWLFVAIVAAAVIAAFCCEPVRTLAGEFLDVFRIERLKLITITPQDMVQLEELLRRGGNLDLENFGHVEVKGQFQDQFVTISQAQQALDFPLRLPSIPRGYTGPELRLCVYPTVSFRLNVENVNSFLRSLGSQRLLPTALEGKTFAIRIHPVCVAIYRGGKGTITVAQTRSPEMTVPAGVEVEEVRQALLGIPGLPDNLRRQLVSLSDWRDTLPVPTDGSPATEVSVNGCPGVFFWPSSAPEEHPASLLWLDNGVVHLLHGPLTLDQARGLAASLR